MPLKPCSMVSAPASTARRMPSAVVACTATGRPDECAASTAARSSSSVKVGCCAAVRAPAVVRVELDPVRPAAGLLAHRAHHLGHAARFLRPLRRTARVRAQTARRRAVAAGGHDGARGDEQARTRDHALLDRALQRHVGVLRAFGSQVAQAGEPGEQRRTCLLRGAQRAVGHRLLQYLVVPGGLVVGVQEQVGMRVDQARQQRGPGELDDPCIGGGRQRCPAGPRVYARARRVPAPPSRRAAARPPSKPAPGAARWREVPRPRQNAAAAARARVPSRARAAMFIGRPGSAGKPDYEPKRGLTEPISTVVS